MSEERDPINELIVESGLDPAEYTSVADALTLLVDVVPTDAPAPSAELAALLSGGAVTPLPANRPRRRRVAIASAVAATVVVGTGVAAAANTLPEPIQQFVSDVSDEILPFHIPSPDERDGANEGDNGNRGEPTSPNGLGRDGESSTNPGQHRGEGKAGDKSNNGKSPDDPGKPDTTKPDGKRPDHADVPDGPQQPDRPDPTKNGNEPVVPEPPDNGKKPQEKPIAPDTGVGNGGGSSNGGGKPVKGG